MHNPIRVANTNKNRDLRPQARRPAFEFSAASAAAASSFSALPPAPLPNPRMRVDLAGLWERYIRGKLLDIIPVPSSLSPSGLYSLQREFVLPALSSRQRAILHFDAVNYHSRALINGDELGATTPYVPIEFEFTKQAKEGKNRVEVAIADLRPGPGGAGKDEIALGVNPGWEAYGGIIRDVYVELRPATYIDNVRFGYQLSEGYRKASCRALVSVASSTAESARLEVVLLKGRPEVARAERAIEVVVGPGEAEVSFELAAPDLWSPEEPNLYELQARLRTENGEDAWNVRTGFREVAIRGNRFELNGRPLVLNGVCRHDMWKDQGFTLTREQMAQDMLMIKALGANFVRLVHYPHHRHVVELADQLGLLVTEEPGYWNMDFRTMPRTIIELGYRIMEATIRRDWNSPSVFAWLLGNECTLTAEYLREGKERCRKLDPLSRPVSFANSMSPQKAKPIFEQAGMDFFDSHPYPSDPREYANTAKFYGDSRPLTFSEWGWEGVGEGDIFPESHSELINDLVKEGKLAGHSFWSWQDMRQYSRIDWPTADGILMSGVVNEAREVRADWWMELSALFQGRAEEPGPPDAQPSVLPLKYSPAQPSAVFSPVDLRHLVESSQGVKAWTELETAFATYWARASMAYNQWKRAGGKFLLWKAAPESALMIGGVPFRIPIINGYVRPLLLTPREPVTIPFGGECERLHILGQVTFPLGYPVLGKRGATVATYYLAGSDGRERQLLVRNGVEVAQANLIDMATRIEPIATAAQPALKYVKDVVREQYQVLLWTVAAEGGSATALRCKLQQGAPAIAIFAITGER